MADAFKLVLRVGDGKYYPNVLQIILMEIFSEPSFVLSTSVLGNQTNYMFGGLSLDTLYHVSLSCLFGSESFKCGHETLTTSAPALVTSGEVSSVYSVSEVASSWDQAEDTCVAGGGHLVSLGNMVEETRVMEAIDVTDIWTGGNMCPDSPGKNIFTVKLSNIS